MVPESENGEGTPVEQDTAVIEPVAEEAREGVEPAPVVAIEASVGHDVGALDFVLDVPLRVTVEIGSARMLVRDVLQLGKGSVVELDRMTGEPADVLVNERLVARGEVTVIEDRLAVKVVEVIGSDATRRSGT